ncbi:MAG: hypothetical protein JO055_05080 [Alphaproteobacteria bacterium]|nr:hypothetical protein [Alphaproteobacteria bacterium]
MVNAWVLSLIICSATPLPDGGYCETRAVDYALTREQCKAALAAEKPRIKPPMRLECTEDPALSAALEEMDGPSDAALPLSRANARRTR